MSQVTIDRQGLTDDEIEDSDEENLSFQTVQVSKERVQSLRTAVLIRKNQYKASKKSYLVALARLRAEEWVLESAEETLRRERLKTNENSA